MSQLDFGWGNFGETKEKKKKKVIQLKPKRKVNSKKKGNRGELELAHLFKEYGFNEARRGVQYDGSKGNADVIGLPGIHVEAKYVEKLDLYKAIDQAEEDALPSEIPIVFHRKSRVGWSATLSAKEFLKLYKELLELRTKIIGF